MRSPERNVNTRCSNTSRFHYFISLPVGRGGLGELGVRIWWREFWPDIDVRRCCSQSEPCLIYIYKKLLVYGHTCSFNQSSERVTSCEWNLHAAKHGSTKQWCVMRWSGLTRAVLKMTCSETLRLIRGSTYQLMRRGHLAMPCVPAVCTFMLFFFGDFSGRMQINCRGSWLAVIY